MGNPIPSSDALKLCPFCGSGDVELRASITDAQVACCDCGARTGLIYLGADDAANAFNMRELVTAWNRRALSDQPDSTNEGLAELLREIAYNLTDQQHEPWPDGTDADRLHYWRDKAIKAANELTALSTGRQA